MFYIKDFFIRSTFALISILLLLAVLYQNKVYIDFLLISPTLKTPFPVYYLIFTQITEGFLIYLRSLLFLSQIFMFPYLFWLLVDYFKPALYTKEHLRLSYLLFLCFLLTPLFFFVFTNLVYPYLWSFFSSFDYKSEEISFFFEVRGLDYLAIFFSTLAVTYGILGLFLLGYLFSAGSQFTTPVFLLKQKKHIQFLFLLTSTLLTPPDVYSQVVTFFFLFFSMESILYFQFLIKIFRIELERKPVETNQNAGSQN